MSAALKPSMRVIGQQAVSQTVMIEPAEIHRRRFAEENCLKLVSLMSGSDLRALHGVPEHPKSSFKPLIFKGFFVFDVP